MKNTLVGRYSLAAVLMFVFASSFAFGQAADWRQIPIPPLPAFQPVEPKRIELPNGMVIFLQEDHELPLIDGFARIRGGSREEPGAKTGLVDDYGAVWRTVAIKPQTVEQLDDFLEAHAATVPTASMPAYPTTPQTRPSRAKI